MHSANELHAKEKEIVTGVVQRINDNGDMTIDNGRTQAVLKADDNLRISSSNAETELRYMLQA